MGDNLSLEERRFELDKLKAEHDFELRKLEIALKQREIGWGTKLFSPLTTTLLAGILTLAASATATLLQGRHSLDLENEKFKSSRTLETQKQQHELVLKMIGVSDPEQGKQNLKFLASSGLISEELADKVLASLETDVFPLIPPTSTTLSPLRGARPGCTFEFVSAPTPGNPEAIQILGNWEQENIVTVDVPQLSKALGDRFSGIVRFNKRGAAALKAAWAEIEQKGLVDRVVSWDGSFVPRFIRGSRTTLSAHACGTAFNINSAFNPLGKEPAALGERGSVRELAPIFEKHGFFWGGRFTSHPQGNFFEFKITESDTVASDTSSPSRISGPRN